MWNPCGFHAAVSTVCELLPSIVHFLGDLRLQAAIFVRAGWRNKTMLHLTSRHISSPGAGVNAASPRGFVIE
jgi:hypothetical protein